MYCRDGTGFDRYFLGNPRHFVADNGLVMEVSNSEPFWFPHIDMLGMSELTVAEDAMDNKGRKPKDKKIPRPPNAYILYRKDHHTMVKEANPGITNNEICKLHAFETTSCILTFESSGSRCCLAEGVAGRSRQVQTNVS